jgi:hypothetical protein
MTEKGHSQTRRVWGNSAVTQLNRQTGHEIYLLDLDYEGAKIETPFPLSPQYHVEFSFLVPGDPVEIKVSGRVLCKQQLSVPAGRYHLRVQFYAPRWDLDRLLARNQPHS